MDYMYITQNYHGLVSNTIPSWSFIRLLDIPKSILEKYKDKLPNGKILPIISNQKMNDYLKAIAAICGIEKTLIYHVAWHSCATSVLLANGVPIGMVSKILGHTNIRTTQIYAKVSNDMEMLAQKLKELIFSAIFVPKQH